MFYKRNIPIISVRLDFGGAETESGGYEQLTHGLLRIELEHQKRPDLEVQLIARI